MKGTLAPLRYAPFRYLVTGRTISMFGNAMAGIALAFAVLDLTGSTSDVGLVVGARSIVNIVFLLFGGVVADRLPRQLVLVVSSGASFLTQGVIAVLILTGDATIPVLMGLAAVNGLTSAFAFPASSALIAQTIPGELRKAANALNRLGLNLSSIVGVSAGGLIVAAFGPGWGLVVDSGTFLAAAALFALVRVPTVRSSSAPRTSTLHELRVGWTEFVARRWVWIVVLGFCFYNMAHVAAIGVLGPAVADSTFGRPTWGFLLAAETVGAVAGAFVAIRLRARRLLLVGVVACVVPAGFIAALALSLPVGALVAVAFCSGIALEQFGIAWETSVQEHIPADKLARVYSYDALGSFLAIPVGQIAAGSIAIWLGTEGALLTCAAVALVATLGMLASRSVRTLVHEPAKPSSAKPAIEPEPAGTAA